MAWKLIELSFTVGVNQIMQSVCKSRINCLYFRVFKSQGWNFKKLWTLH